MLVDRWKDRWHTRAWAQAVIQEVESDTIKRLEAYPAKDVEMDLTGTDIPDDEFPEEPHVEEAKVPEEVQNAVRLAIIRIHKNLGHPSKELLRRVLRIGGANKIVIRTASELKWRRFCGEQTSEKSCAFEVGRHIHRIQSRCKSGSLCTRGLKRTSV